MVYSDNVGLERILPADWWTTDLRPLGPQWQSHSLQGWWRYTCTPPRPAPGPPVWTGHHWPISWRMTTALTVNNKTNHSYVILSYRGVHSYHLTISLNFLNILVIIDHFFTYIGVQFFTFNISSNTYIYVACKLLL